MTTRAIAIVLSISALAGCAAEKLALNEVARPEIVIESIPRGALVTEGATELGATPLVFRAGSATSEHRLTLKRDGFLPQEISVAGAEVAAHSGQRLYVPLRPASWDAKSKPIDPDDAGQLVRAGADLAKAGKCPEAIPFFRRVAQIDPRFAAAHKGLGTCYAKLGRRADAVNAYKQYLLYAPDAPDVEKVREIVSRAEGDIDLAPANKE